MVDKTFTGISEVSARSKEVLCEISEKWSPDMPVIVLPNEYVVEKTSVSVVHGIVLANSTAHPHIAENARSEKVILNSVSVGITDHIIDNIKIFSKYFSWEENGLLLLGAGITDDALESLQDEDASIVVESLSGNEESQNRIRDDVARFTGGYVLKGRSFVEKDLCSSNSFEEENCLGGSSIVTVITSRYTYIMLGLGDIYGTCGQLESITNILLVELGSDVESDAANLTEIIEDKYPE